jgi:hypothetical protein
MKKIIECLAFSAGAVALMLFSTPLSWANPHGQVQDVDASANAVRRLAAGNHFPARGRRARSRQCRWRR